MEKLYIYTFLLPIACFAQMVINIT